MCLGLYGRTEEGDGGAATETHVTDRVVVDLEKLGQCGRQGKGWYVSIVYVNATPWQAIRSTACTLRTDPDESTCSECSGLPRNNSSFRGAVLRTMGKKAAAAGSVHVERARQAKKKKHGHTNISPAMANDHVESILSETIAGKEVSFSTLDVLS